MNIDTLIKHMENKSIACQSKMQVSKDKGFLDLYEVFNNEDKETQITLHLLRKATENIHFSTNKEVREKMVLYVIQETPDLAFYFKKGSIDKVLADAVERAFDRLAEENFKNRLVNLVE